MKRILVINGPNLNMIGKREASHYGMMTLEALEDYIRTLGTDLHMDLTFFQSNSEGGIIDRIQASDGFDGMIINAGAYTHYSHAIGDALMVVSCPVIEVHMSNIHNRETFRSTSVLTRACVGQISGFKEESYRLALYALDKILNV